MNLQLIPRIVSPYLVLAGIPPPIIENYDSRKNSVQQCMNTTKKIEHVTILNNFTDDLSFGTKWNITTTLKFLYSNKNNTSFTYTKNDFKDHPHQLIFGSCEAAIGNYWFDPWLKKLSDATKKITYMEEFEYDDVVLCLAFVKTAKNILVVYSSDVDNIYFIVIPLMLI